MQTSTNITKKDTEHLRYCLSLAKEALNAGDEPFGSILVDANNNVIAEARNRVNEKTALAHPEIELAQWAADNLNVQERKNITMYTTGEHCPMCAAAHGWVGIGSLVYLSSGKQLNTWLNEFGAEPAPIKFIPSEEIIKNSAIKGPAKGPMLEKIKNLHRKYYQ
ncbi:tRNA(Arg) A34 adenosine deaminase TadA [Salegentibacter echinorum]|uniref:tRNA(Arg) A34 adenosine deaminase TadA n=1 Tax=Salegentibacter echinorum TaxID=1073325 RepID=A0A1M5EI35_SALEC|nr:nucleoside deaminase [Salegentibacter echinorum]SHF78711.1 tRNA(Arg) A34 adenosine deaminase TadA [Salegentibacter echinorum]